MLKINIHAIDTKIKAQASLQLYSIIEEKYSGNPAIMSLGENIKQKANELISAIGPRYDKDTTRKLRELDAARDSAFRIVYNLIDIYSNKNIYPENHGTGTALLEKIAPAGISFLRGAYLAETTLIEKAIVHLKSDEYKEFINGAGANDIISRIETLNNSFKDLYQSRIDKKNETPAPAKTFDRALNNALNSLVYYVSSIDFNSDEVEDLFRPILDAFKKRYEPVTPTDETPAE